MKKYLVTSALLYVNGLPHLGHLVGCLLPSDVFVRFLRAKGENVLYVGGTDEHGAASEIQAQKEGMSCEECCLKYHLKHKDIYDRFELSFDCFGRTSDEENKEITYRIFNGLYQNGYIEEKEISQVYSIDDGTFLADRYIIGTCPFCGYEKARGDQCEACTHVLNPTDLINAHSSISGSSNLEVRKTKHLFLKLSALQKDLEKWVAGKEFVWPEIAYSTAQKWLKEGLNDRCITRDLKWGFPVPLDGMKDKVFYCWFDAPIGYIGITKKALDARGEKWEDWWLADDVRHVEFMGKDNIPFHSVFFPAYLLGSGENWTQVDFLKGVNYLNFNGGKFSKTEQRGIFADQALEEFPADYWRYWLIANIPEGSDASFNFEAFASTINKDLNGILGNFVNRVLKMTQNNFGLQVPVGGEIGFAEEKLFDDLNQRIKEYTLLMEQIEFRKAVAVLREIWGLGNDYIANREPWKVLKEDKEQGAMILRVAINLIRIFGILSAPIMPEFARKVGELLKAPVDGWVWDAKAEFNSLKPGAEFAEPSLLFNRITPEKVQELKIKYKED